MTRNIGLFLLAGLCAAYGAAIGNAREPVAGANQISFPEKFSNGVLYTTVDRADNKQYRELFSTPEAIDALKAGKPIPSGTVLTLVQYKAKLDAQGNPEKDGAGRFIKSDLIGYAVMEKRTGWGSDYGDDIEHRCNLD